MTLPIMRQTLWQKGLKLDAREYADATSGGGWLIVFERGAQCANVWVPEADLVTRRLEYLQAIYLEPIGRKLGDTDVLGLFERWLDDRHV